MYNNCQTNSFMHNLEIDLLKIRGKYVFISISLFLYCLAHYYAGNDSKQCGNE